MLAKMILPCGTRAVLVGLSLLLGGAQLALAEDWPQWRGPNLNGVSTEQNLPTTWGPDNNVAWRVDLPGPAGSTPVVWGQQIFLTSADDDRLLLMCFSTAGKELWVREITTGNRAVRGDEGNSAAPSPLTDGQYVWAMFATGDLVCYDLAGELVWKTNLQERYGKFKIGFGMTSTPVLRDDRLYLQLIHSGGALVLCLDKNSGDEIWKQPRPSDAVAECEHSYASPTIYEDRQRRFLLTHGADYVVAHDLATGEELWRCGGLNPPGEKYNRTLRFVSSPVAVPGLIVVPSAKRGPVLGLAPTGEGNITGQLNTQLWRLDRDTPDVPSPVVYDGLVYLCREDGILYCLDAKTGELVYRERTHSDRHRASPVVADGKLYLCSRDGTVSVVKLGRQFELLASNKLDEEIASSPAIANGRIYIRTFQGLWAIGQ